MSYYRMVSSTGKDPKSNGIDICRVVSVKITTITGTCQLLLELEESAYSIGPGMRKPRTCHSYG
jgi:hypothetical protein